MTPSPRLQGTPSEGQKINEEKKMIYTKPFIYPFNSGNEIVWNDGTHNDILELDVLARFGVAFHRLDVTNDLGILAGTTSLLFVGTIELGFLGDSFTESDTRLSCGIVDIVFSAQAFNIDLEVEFTHS